MPTRRPASRQARSSPSEPPAQVHVGPFTFRLVVAPIAPEHQPAWGVTEPRLELITIDPSQGGTFKRDTVFHEVIHAALFASGVGLGEGEEERLVSALSPVLLDVVRSNPALMAYLAGDG